MGDDQKTAKPAISTSSIFANAARTPRHLAGAQQASKQETLACRTCGAPRVDGRDDLVCAYCGTTLSVASE